MKELIVKTSLAGALVLAGGFYAYDEHRDQAKVEQLQAKYEKQLSDVKNDNLGLRDDIRTVSENNLVLQNKADELQVQVSEKDQQISEKDQTIQSQSAEISKLKKQIDESPRRITTSVTPSVQTSSSEGYTTFSASAYTTGANGDPWTSSKWGNKTASGTSVQQGRTIAVDRNLIPLGTKLEVKFPEPFSYMNGVYTAEDTGNGIKGHEVDVYFDSYQTCVNFGVRQIQIKIL